ncbi:MAG: IS1595 family transposase [Pikeienuella sp.]
MKQTTVRQFFAQFPTDEACLDHLFNVRFGQGHSCPKCERDAKWYRLKSEQAYSCQWCGHHIHPMVGTIFEKSRTPLQLWFYAMFLFTTSKHGVSGKELQRQLGVTYKTAWRMCAQIRKHMAEVDGDAPIGGEGEIVEVDETFIGGYKKGAMGGKGKTVLIGMVEKDGDIVTKVIPNRSHRTVRNAVIEAVEPGSELHTDEFGAYKYMGPDYSHETVNHSQDEYVREDGVTTNTIEGAFSHFKRSIAGTHTSISPKYLGSYAKEFEFRYNRRKCQASMLPELLTTFPKTGV